MGHDHNHLEESSTLRLLIVAIVNFIGFIAELAGGLLFGSVSLIADSVHMLSDSLAYFIALFAALFAEKSPRNSTFTYGYHRIEPIAALINALLLLPLFFLVLYHAYTRYIEPVTINAEYAILVAIFGLIVNVVSILILEKDSLSLNEKAAWRHLAVDALASVATIIGLTLVMITGNVTYDIIMALIVSIFILWTIYKIFSEVAFLFMHASPIDIEDTKENIASIDTVKSVNDIHIWNVCGQISVATVQITLKNDTYKDYNKSVSEIHNILHSKGVSHITVEADGEYRIKNHNHSHEH